VTLFLDSDDIRALATDSVCEQAAMTAVHAESSGRCRLPGRIDVPSGNGFLRVMPAVLDSVMGLKVMTLAEGIGNRYLVLLYAVGSGELLGAFDAEELTRLRTSAFTAAAAKLMVHEAPRTLALIGSGFEAEGHLRALSRLWDFTAVSVFSPSPERRAAFAARHAAESGKPVDAVETAERAVADADVVMLATKSRTAVLDGAAVKTGAVVLSVGSTRPNLRELDAATMRRTGTLVVDDTAQVTAESGDVMCGLRDGDLTIDRLVSVATLSEHPELLLREEGRDLVTFKSVGTALQDLALAQLVLTAAVAAGRGRDLGELAALKPFADNAVRVSS
jgi:ornithine cyclodeaminase/alanine dehydrogenase